MIIIYHKQFEEHFEKYSNINAEYYNLNSYFCLNIAIHRLYIGTRKGILVIEMMSIALLIPFICTLIFVDAATIDKHVNGLFERQSTEDHEATPMKIGESYDINEDGSIVAEEMWTAEDYGHPTNSIGNMRFWVKGFGINGSRTLDQCFNYLNFTTNALNHDPKQLCEIVDMNDDQKICADEILATPDDLFTLVFPFNPHIIETAEAEFSIRLYDNEIMGGNGNDEMDFDECKHFLSVPSSPIEVPTGLCKVIAGDDDLITPKELHDHFVIMEHKEVEFDLAQFVIKTFDTEDEDENLNQNECLHFFTYFRGSKHSRTK